MLRPSVLHCPCFVCGRPLEVLAEHAGRPIACPHCGGRFVARRQARPVIADVESRGSLLERADRLLALSAKRLLGAPAPAPLS